MTERGVQRLRTREKLLMVRERPCKDPLAFRLGQGAFGVNEAPTMKTAVQRGEEILEERVAVSE